MSAFKASCVKGSQRFTRLFQVTKRCFFFVAFNPLEMRNDGRNPANQLIGIVYTIIYEVLYFSGG